jgi:hypothetical protein
LYELLFAYDTKICVQRIDQSMFVLIEKLSSNLNLRSRGKYIDISTTPQPAIIAAYNAVEFLFHFIQNGVDLGPFILSYFNNATLLQYGDNLVFNSKMDNVYGAIVLAYFFNEGEGSIINRNIISQKASDVNAIADNTNSQCTSTLLFTAASGTGSIEYDVANSTYKTINGDDATIHGYQTGKAIFCMCGGNGKFSNANGYNIGYRKANGDVPCIYINQNEYGSLNRTFRWNCPLTGTN